MDNFGVAVAWTSPAGNNYIVVDDDYLVDEGGDYLIFA